MQINDCESPQWLISLNISMQEQLQDAFGGVVLKDL